MGLKSRLKTYPRLTQAQLIHEVDKYDVISFDAFDTLLKRDLVFPHDVFDLAERMYNKRSQKEMVGFREARIKAERIARRDKTPVEVTLGDIYRQLAFMDWMDEETVNAMVGIELEAEAAVSCSNPLMKAVFEYSAQKGKKILVISDMYLGRAFIEGLLQKNGFQGYSSVYVSSEYGAQKRNGKLYEIVQEKEKVPPEKWLHIGDSICGDYLAAKKKGIHAVCIASSQQNTEYLSQGNTLDEGAVFSFINNRLPMISDHNIAMGYEVYGPLLYGFVKWLVERLDPQKTSLFFARDCYVVLPAYEKIAGYSTRSHYFEASRKSLIIPAMARNCSIQKAASMMRSEPIRISLAGFLRKFDLDPEEYRARAEKYGLRMDSILLRNHLMEDNVFVSFWNEIEPEIKKKAQAANEAFHAYFCQFDSTEAIQIVDIGWRCTMQYCLKQLLPSNYTLHGYYFGVREDTFLSSDEYNGFFLSGEDNENKKAFLASMPALFEIFFSAPYGSVEGYSEDGTVIHTTYECMEDPASEALVKALQKGALRFIDDLIKSPLRDWIEVDEKSMFRGLAKLGMQPNRNDLDSIGSYPFRMGTAVVKTASPKTIGYYMLHAKQLMYDFANSNWKIAFMKRLLKIRMPYYKIFCLIYRNK